MHHRGRIGTRSEIRGAAFAAAVAVGALFPLAGCGGGDAGKQLDALRAELGRLRAKNATLEARLELLEAARAAEPSAPPDAEEGGADRPDLDVVKVGPELGAVAGAAPGRPHAADAADAAGSEDAGGEARVVLRSGPGGAVVEVAAPPEASPAEDASRILDQAQELYRTKKYERAIEVLAVLAARAPSHARADEALLLRADCYAAKNEHRRAVELYGEVLRGFPKSARAGEALSRMARSYEKLGDAASAEQARTRLRALGKSTP